MALFCVLSSFTAVTALADSLPAGTYRALRTCSDGSAPRDRLNFGVIHIVIRSDGTFRSVARTTDPDGAIYSDVMEGQYAVTADRLTTQSKSVAHCGPCTFGGEYSDSASYAPLSKGFRTIPDAVFEDDAASCPRGQRMIFDFIRYANDLQDLKPNCDENMGF